MKSINKLNGLALVIICSIGLIACADKELPEQEVLPSEETNLTFIRKTDYLTRNVQDEVFYFVMPDRFHNANKSNDNGDPNRPISFGGLNLTSKWAFHGGDIAGIEAKLDYIEGLGVTSIWMTPILRNRAMHADGTGQHGNWVVDFTEIDPHFGSNDDLKSLIEAAHKRDIKIFFDIITNYTADVIKYEECHNQDGKFLSLEQKACAYISTEERATGKIYTPFIRELEIGVKVPAWLNDPKFYNNQGDSFGIGESAIKGDLFGLDDLDTSQPEVISGLTAIFKDLVSEFRPDGFRINALKHADMKFWQSFGPALMQHAQSVGLPEFFIFGDANEGSQAGLSKFTTGGKLPSVLDYSFAFDVRDVVFGNKSVIQLRELFNNDDFYRDGDSSPNDLINFLGSQDLGRVGHFIEKGFRGISDEQRVARSQVAHALMYYSRGIPVVYYGDEQGFTGDGGGVDAAENMDPSNVSAYNDNKLLGTSSTTSNSNFDIDHPLYISFYELAKVRHAHKSLRQGEHLNRILDEEKSLYGFSRILPNDMIDHLVVFNFSTQQQQTSMSVGSLEYEKLSGHTNSTVELSGDQLMLNLAPLSYILLKSNIPLAKSMVQDISMQPSYEENDRVFLPFDLTFNNPEQFNFAQIKVFSIDAKGQKTLLAFDTTAPYRAILLPTLLVNISKIEVQADNFKGQTKTKVFDFSM